MGKRNQKTSRNSFEIKFNCPAISVIIPLYNVEKYVGECLDSLLAQTFQNFEVIVVNDCSTDSSPAIVESYKKKFGGRLKLYKTEINSGACATPRNVGFPFSRGEYVFFMDADDLFTKTALEELYTLAKNYDADVVYNEKFFTTIDGKNVKIISWQRSEFVDKPTLDPSDLATRVKMIVENRYCGTCWCKFIKRTLLNDNSITFPTFVRIEDNTWTYELILRAKRILRVPNTVYVYRQADESLIRKSAVPNHTMLMWMDSVIYGTFLLEKLMDQFELFSQKPEYRYLLRNYHITQKGFFQILLAPSQLKPHEFCKVVDQKFSNYLGKHSVLISHLCSIINLYQRNLNQSQQQFNQFAAQAQSQVKKFNQFAQQAQQRIAELEAEVKRLQGK